MAWLLLTLFLGLTGRAAEPDAAKGRPGPFSLPEIGDKAGSSAFDPAKVAFVLAWLHEKVPALPDAEATATAEKFLEDLSLHSPAAFEQLPGADFSRRDYESALLRHVGRQLGGAAQVGLREAVARRRIAALLTAQNGANAPAHDADEAFGRIQTASAFNARRLLEGKMEDDELLRLCQQSRDASGERKETVAAPVTPRELTALEIVSEFVRHNQRGAALSKLAAYSVEAQVRTPGGAEQTLVVFKLRPDRFRIFIGAKGVVGLVIAFDGERFWRQVPGRPPEVVAEAELGPIRYLREFLDPFFESEGFAFERREDGTVAGRKCYRIAVKRADGSGFVAALDQENFHELGREDTDGGRVVYSDFSDFAGITVSHREEATNADGGKTFLEITRMAANPGIIQACFQAPAAGELDFFTLQRLMAEAPAAAVKPSTATN